MDHSIKINRAFAQSKIGQFPTVRAEALSLIPESVISWASSTTLAKLLDALHQSHQAGRHIESASILADGAIFDPRLNKMRELCA